MRFLFIQKFAGRGGSKLCLLDTLRALTVEDPHPACVVVGEQGPLVEECARLGVPVFLADLPEWRKWTHRWRFGLALRRLARRLAHVPVDCVISNEMWWAPHAARLARHLNCRSAVFLRDGIATPEKARKYRLQATDRILSTSSTIAEQLSRDPIFVPRLTVVLDSVSVPRSRQGQEASLRERLAGFPLARRWLAVVGKIGPRKNQIDAVILLKHLLDAGHEEWGLLLAGDLHAAYSGALQQTVERMGLAGRVACLGHIEDVESVYRIADQVVLTSTREGLPRSLVEGLLMGRPCFAYPCEGVDDIFGPHVRRFVSEAKTPAALADRMLVAWADPPATHAALAEVRHRVETQFSPAAHRAMLERALAAPSARGAGEREPDAPAPHPTTLRQ